MICKWKQLFSIHEIILCVKMIHPKTELQFINKEIGYGVVATEFIPAGTITWVLDKLDREFTRPNWNPWNLFISPYWILIPLGTTREDLYFAGTTPDM